MARSFVQHLAFYNNDNLPNCVKNLPSRLKNCQIPNNPKLKLTMTLKINSQSGEISSNAVTLTCRFLSAANVQAGLVITR